MATWRSAWRSSRSTWRRTTRRPTGAGLGLSCLTVPVPSNAANCSTQNTTAAAPIGTPASEHRPLRTLRRVLRFLFTEINYGGRVTDDKDRRLINNLVDTFCGPDVLQGGYRCAGGSAASHRACHTHTAPA
jgi:hypothetical protein